MGQDLYKLKYLSLIGVDTILPINKASTIY